MADARKSSRGTQIAVALIGFAGFLLGIPLKRYFSHQSEGFLLTCLTIIVAPLFLLYLAATVRDWFRKARK